MTATKPFSPINKAQGVLMADHASSSIDGTTDVRLSYRDLENAIGVLRRIRAA